MKKMILICLSVLLISCSAIAEIDMRDFYAKNSKQISAVLDKKLEKPSSWKGGKELAFPLFMKAELPPDISSMVHTPDGLLIKTTTSKVSFIRESSGDIFFVRGGSSLFEAYSDAFTMDMNELEKKYVTHTAEKQGIFDFKIGLSILSYEEKGYYQIGGFIIYVLLGKDSSEAFILNKGKPNMAMRVGYIGDDHNEFKKLITNIKNFN